MNSHFKSLLLLLPGLLVVLIAGCANIPVKQYYVLNYSPSSIRDRLNPAAYNCTIRLREFDVEEAYTRPQIVYRQSPFQLAGIKVYTPEGEVTDDWMAALGYPADA